MDPDRDWAGNVAEVVGRHRLSNPHYEPVRKKRLSPPEFVKLGTIKWGRTVKPL